MKMKINSKVEGVFFSPLEGIFRSTPTIPNSRNNKFRYASLHNTSRSKKSKTHSQSSERNTRKRKINIQRENKTRLNKYLGTKSK